MCDTCTLLAYWVLPILIQQNCSTKMHSQPRAEPYDEYRICLCSPRFPPHWLASCAALSNGDDGLQHTLGAGD